MVAPGLAALRMATGVILLPLYLSTSRLSGPATNLVLWYMFVLLIMVVFLITVTFWLLFTQ
jgi:hypothetical protein